MQDNSKEQLLRAMDSQTRRTLQCVENPQVLLEFLHLAAAMPEKSAQQLLLIMSQHSRGGFRLKAPQPGARLVWVSEWEKTPQGIEKVPHAYSIDTVFEGDRDVRTRRLECALRSIGVKPAETFAQMQKQFTPSAYRLIYSEMCYEYGLSVLPDNFDVQAKGAAYINAVAFNGDQSGAGLKGLWDPGAVSGPGALSALTRMTSRARQFSQEVNEKSLNLLRSAGRPARMTQTARPAITDTKTAQRPGQYLGR